MDFFSRRFPLIYVITVQIFIYMLSSFEFVELSGVVCYWDYDKINDARTLIFIVVFCHQALFLFEMPAYFWLCYLSWHWSKRPKYLSQKHKNERHSCHCTFSWSKSLFFPQKEPVPRREWMRLNQAHSCLCGSVPLASFSVPHSHLVAFLLFGGWFVCVFNMHFAFPVPSRFMMWLGK